MSIGRPDYSNGKEEAPSPRRKPQDCRLALGFERVGLLVPALSMDRRADRSVAVHRCGVRHRTPQGRRFAQPAVPLGHAGVQAVRGSDAALPVERIRRAGRGRGQDAAGARIRWKSCATSSPTCNWSTGTRGIISLFSARQPPENGQLPAPLFPETLPRARPTTSSIERVQVERDHPRQASVRGRRTGADRAGARSRRRRAATSSTTRSREIRKTMAGRPRAAPASRRSSPACR